MPATKQPEWEVVYETDYSTLYRDKSGEYEAELMIREEIEDTRSYGAAGDEDAVETIEVEYYRFSLDRLKLVASEEDPLKSYLVSEAYEESWPHPLSMYEEWFAKDLKGIAESMGTTVEELVAGFCSEDIRQRAWAWECVGGYFGWMNLDSYPERKREEV